MHNTSLDMKYFCVHHPLLTDRRIRQEYQFQYLKIDVEWVTSFSPDSISIPSASSFKNINEYSLYLKQRFCIEQQVKHKYDYALIFEDDVLLPHDFNTYLRECMIEFTTMSGDILFLGKCCNIGPTVIYPHKKVYHEQHYLSRCAHCYVTTLHAAEKIYKHIDTVPKAYDFKLNEIIQLEKLKSCFCEPGIYQGSQDTGVYESTLGN